jgi:hypothetical protein
MGARKGTGICLRAEQDTFGSGININTYTYTNTHFKFYLKPHPPPILYRQVHPSQVIHKNSQDEYKFPGEIPSPTPRDRDRSLIIRAVSASLPVLFSEIVLQVIQI